MITAGDVWDAQGAREIVNQSLGKDYPWYLVIGGHDLEYPPTLAFARTYNAHGKTLTNIVNPGPSGDVCFLGPMGLIPSTGSCENKRFTAFWTQNHVFNHFQTCYGHEEPFTLPDKSFVLAAIKMFVLYPVPFL